MPLRLIVNYGRDLSVDPRQDRPMAGIQTGLLGLNGLLCPPGDAGALAVALEELKEDPGLGERLSGEALATVLRSHTWQAVAERILRLAETAGAPPLVAGCREVP